MSNMKAIKRRRNTVANIEQITNAMNLVSTSKLQRARARKDMLARPLRSAFDLINNTLSGINPDLLSVHQFVAPRENPKTAYVIMTSNRGLCGSYNSNVCKALMNHQKQFNIDKPLIICAGTRGRDFFSKREYDVYNMPDHLETASWREAEHIAHTLFHMFVDGVIDEVYVVYTKFITILNLEPTVKKILPIDANFIRRSLNQLVEDEHYEDLGFFNKPSPIPPKHFIEVLYEPSLDAVFEEMIPWYMISFIYAAMTASSLCEQAARMTSMDSASKNAEDIIDDLTLMFNRQRQSSITQEITEIVSGANALD